VQLGCTRAPVMGSPSLPVPASTREMRDRKGIMGIRVSVFFPHAIFVQGWANVDC
jgi:hypothetical protein